MASSICDQQFLDLDHNNQAYNDYNIQPSIHTQIRDTVCDPAITNHRDYTATVCYVHARLYIMPSPQQ